MKRWLLTKVDENVGDKKFGFERGMGIKDAIRLIGERQIERRKVISLFYTFRQGFWQNNRQLRGARSSGDLAMINQIKGRINISVANFWEEIALKNFSDLGEIRI